ncbi:MAG: trypsin-like peptidase domain-containing protein [Bacillota bacterium]
MTMSEYGPSKKPALIVSLLMSLVGFILGGLFVSVLFFYFQPRNAENTVMPDQQSAQFVTENVSFNNYGNLPAADIVEKVAPAVVSVSNYASINQRGQQALVEKGTGSGVVVSSDGYIVTNYHVIEGADQIAVVFSGSDKLQAELVGADPLTDLALLKINRDQLAFLALGNPARFRVGETVIAVGNPLGLFQQSVTVGVVSALEREVSIPGSEYTYTYIQTDAAINAGNSGGPLINLKGQMIGINSAKVSTVGVEGIGFAIPVNTVKRVVEDLIKYGAVKRPLLGVRVLNLSGVTGISTDRGVYIHEVAAGGAAAEAGLQAGDCIVGINDQEINYLAQLFDTLLAFYPGDKIDLKIMRGGAVRIIDATLQ